MNFTDQIAAAEARHQSLLCVGLDPEPARFPGAWKGDASRILAHQLIGAKLNVANYGLNWPALIPLINQADAILCTYAGRLPLGIKTSTVVGQQMVAIANQLESYVL